MRKNIKEFLGKPIIAYSIDAALKSNCFEQIIVSTDDNEIAELSKSYGATVPFIRPSNLSDDFTSTFSVVKHALEQKDIITNVKIACCLYATAPFVDARTIKESYKLFKNSDASYCLGVTKFKFPIQRASRVTESNRLEMFNQSNSLKRSQDLSDGYHDAGQFCWGKANAFKNELSMYSGSTIPYILPGHLVQDIDDMEDWLRAEAMYKILHGE